MIKVAIMGYGTVGSGVYEVIKTNQKSIDKKVGQELQIKYVLDLREFPGDPVMEVLTHDFEDIIGDPGDLRHIKRHYQLYADQDGPGRVRLYGCAERSAA